LLYTSPHEKEEEPSNHEGFCVVCLAVCLSAVACAQSTADELIQAIRNNDLPSLKARLAKGADVNARDQRGSTLLMHAAALRQPGSRQTAAGERRRPEREE